MIRNKVNSLTWVNKLVNIVNLYWLSRWSWDKTNGGSLCLKMNRDTQSPLNVDDEHRQAQLWGITFVHHFIRTGMSVETARETGQTDYNPECRKHLTHCWENDECLRVRELVDATNLYCIQDYRYYCRRGLNRLGITSNSR